MLPKEEILSRLKAIADSTGETPGYRYFESCTGIKESDWIGIYWSKWSDAVVEAGLTPNTKKAQISEDALLASFANASLELGRLPTAPDMKMLSRQNPDFPGQRTFYRRFKNRESMLRALLAWIQDKPEYDPLLAFLPTFVETSIEDEEETESTLKEGFVYLLKSLAFYKIGRSDDIEKRIKQISIALPESVELVHVIRTDDPAGIEAYWHRRFADRRANGEWFKLSKEDIRAFKKRKYQ